MIRTYTYPLARCRKAQHDRLWACLRHCTWLRNQVVGVCKEHARATREWHENDKTGFKPEMPKRKELYRKYVIEGDPRDKQWQSLVQDNMINRVLAAYMMTGKIDSAGRRRRKPKGGHAQSFEWQGKPSRCKKSKTANLYKVQLKGIGLLTFVDRRNAIEGAKVNLTRILWTPIGWRIQIVCEHAPRTAKDTRPVVGVDPGVRHNATVTDGEKVRHFSAVEIDERKRKKHQREMARRGEWSKTGKRRCVKNSKRRLKAKRSARKEYYRNAERRKQAVHRHTSEIVREWSATVGIEATNWEHLSRNKKKRRSKAALNRKMRNQALGMQRQQLEYKCADAGGEMLTVNQAYTSQTCVACGHRDKSNEEILTCSSCGNVIQRDAQGAENIRRAALAQLHEQTAARGTDASKEEQPKASCLTPASTEMLNGIETRVTPEDTPSNDRKPRGLAI